MQKSVTTSGDFWKNFPTFSKLRAKEKKEAEQASHLVIHQGQYSEAIKSQNLKPSH